jgi:hypothetical protein
MVYLLKRAEATTQIPPKVSRMMATMVKVVVIFVHSVGW